MKILGLVILYYPDSEVISNINSYINSLDTLIIWDNTPLADRKENRFKNIIDSESILLMHESENVGVGKVLNKAAKYAMEKGYTHLLTMDQDSRFDESVFTSYLSLIKEYKNESAVAYCVNTTKTETSNTIIETELFITSGTIIIVNLFAKIGLFREDFFIDAIDTEYSFRIRRNNFKIIQFSNIFMHHKLGNPEVTPFLWSKLISPNYSAVRTYYLTRNHIILRRLYNRNYSFSKGSFKTIFFWRPICILFVEKNKLRKFLYFLRGVYDGVRMKTGVLNHKV